ncbi:MAG: hypothetical protein RMH75_03140 [Archaeoglobaceae archaeon]|nr:hypothetical protein [Archaeoglobaceae archaeon]MDW7989650.1 hypothetical protein [Archaeoglobaceae archaeon]
MASGIVKHRKEILEKIFRGNIKRKRVFELREETGKALEILSEDSKIETDILGDFSGFLGERNLLRQQLLTKESKISN